MAKRNTAFSLLYVFGIIMVLYRHFCQGNGLIFETLIVTSTYLVNIFYFSSGYFYKEEHEKNIFKTILNKFLKLIVPFFVGTLVYGLIGLIIIQYFTYPVMPLSWTALFISPITSGFQFFFNLASWIIIPLFLSQVFYLVVHKFLKFRFCEFAIFAICLAIGIGGLYLSLSESSFAFKVFLVRLTTAICFYGFGRFYKYFLEKYDDKVNLFLTIIVDILIFAIIFVVKKERIDFTPATGSDLNTNPFLYYFQTFLVLMLLLKICKFLSPAFENSKITNYISQHTFSIMMNHLIAAFVLNLVFYGLSLSTETFADFRKEEFFDNHWYIYLFHGSRFFIIIYIIWAIAFSLLLSYLYSLLKKYTLKGYEKVKDKLINKSKPVSNE